MQFARLYTVPFMLLLSTLHFIVMAAGAAETTMPDPDGGAWLPLIIISLIAIVIATGILVYFLWLVKTFREISSGIIDALRALTPIPIVTIADEIPDGVEGRLEVRIDGFPSLPLETVTVILTPSPGFVLEDDHITLPRFDAGETKIFRIGHNPVRKGKYPRDYGPVSSGRRRSRTGIHMDGVCRDPGRAGDY